VIGDTTGEAFSAARHQFRRRRAEDQVAHVLAGTVGQYAQHGKQIGAPLYFVDDHQPGQRFERQQQRRQPRLVVRVFEIETMHRAAESDADAIRQRRFAGLAGADDGDDGEFVEQAR
jgi:hypothetical protein